MEIWRDKTFWRKITQTNENLGSLPMRLLTAITLSLFTFTALAQSGSSVEPGQFFGAKQTTHPDWFKESFLEFEDDIEEAAAEDKRLMVYFHQDGCPYCNKLVEENFQDPDISAKVRAHFDLVAINMWGDREVVQVGGRQFTEKTLAEALNVNFTPTLLFFSEDRNVALRLDGYHPPMEFIHALDYVSQKKEQEIPYPEYIAGIKEHKSSGDLNTADFIQSPPYDLRSTDKPVAVLFEEPDCEPCDLLHQKTFQNESAPEILAQFDVIQLNRWSNQEVITPDGTNTTALQWSKDLGLSFSPSIALFNTEGEQIILVDAMFKTFHVLGVFDYVASKAYEHEPSFQRYLSERAEHIQATGKDVNIWSY